MVAAFALLPVGLLWYRYPKLALLIPRPVAAVVLGAIFASFYVLLAGFELPAQRTLIMLLVLMSGFVTRHQLRFSQTYSLALLLVLIYDPLACLSAGFWLSFITVGLLVWLSTRHYRLPKWAALRIQLSLSFLSLVLSAAFFGLVSWIAPLANLIAIPWITFIVTPLILIGMLLDLISHRLATLLWQLAALLLDWLMQLLAYLAGLPFAASHTLVYPTIWLIIAGLGIGLLLLPKGMPARWLGFIGLLPLVLYQPPRLAHGSFQLSVLDVGQGSAHVLQTATHVLVFDTGAKSSDSFDMGKRVVLPYLYGQGIRQLDKLMLSHADNDHNGGAIAVTQGISVQEIMGSSPEVLPEYKVTLCQAGQHWQWDGVDFTVLHPSPEFTGKSDNERSCVLRVSNAYHSVLLTGDIEKDAELQLVTPQHSLAAEVLILAHHGSKYSSSYTFLDAVQPKLAIASSGYLNRFNHPHPETIARLTQHAIPWLNTVQSGTISLYFPPDANAFKLEQWRLLNQHIWNSFGQ
jgi:competence protein ComEC